MAGSWRTSSLRYLLLALAILGLLYLSLALGALPTPLLFPLKLLFSPSPSREEFLIFYDLRMNRTLLAFACGGSIAASGLVLQTLFRNPIASPDLIGVSAGSGLGIVVALLMADLEPSPGFSLSALAGAILGATVTLALLATLAPFLSTLMLLIGGLLLSMFLGALTQLFLTWIRPESLQLFYLWSQGGFTRLTLKETVPVSLVLGASLLPLLRLSRSLDALLLGEEYARSMGVVLPRLRLLLFLNLGILIGVGTLAAGPLGFLGVAIPHGARAFARTHRHLPLLLVTFGMGGALAVAADLMSRFSRGGVSFPVNALLGLVGIPAIALILYRSSRREGWS